MDGLQYFLFVTVLNTYRTTKMRSFVGFLLLCLCTSAISGNSSSALNVAGSNVSTISTSHQLPFGIDLSKSIRNKSNHTIHTSLAMHPKVTHFRSLLV